MFCGCRKQGAFHGRLGTTCDGLARIMCLIHAHRRGGGGAARARGLLAGGGFMGPSYLSILIFELLSVCFFRGGQYPAGKKRSLHGAMGTGKHECICG